MITTLQPIAYAYASAALEDKLECIGYKPLPYPFSPHCVYFLRTTDWQVRGIITCFLNLSESYKVSIPQAAMEVVPYPGLWVLLGLHFSGTQPVYYLFPSMLFTRPGHAFARCRRSACSINVYTTKAINALNHYLLSDVNDL